MNRSWGWGRVHDLFDAYRGLVTPSANVHLLQTGALRETLVGIAACSFFWSITSIASAQPCNHGVTIQIGGDQEKCVGSKIDCVGFITHNDDCGDSWIATSASFNLYRPGEVTPFHTAAASIVAPVPGTNACSPDGNFPWFVGPELTECQCLTGEVLPGILAFRVAPEDQYEIQPSDAELEFIACQVSVIVEDFCDANNCVQDCGNKETGCLCDKPHTETRTAQIEIIQPAIDIVKTSDVDTCTSFPVDVTYTYTVTNIGDSPLVIPDDGICNEPVDCNDDGVCDILDDDCNDSVGGICDDHCGPLSGPSGDIGNDGVIDPGEVWTYTCTTTLTEPTTNTVVVQAQTPDRCCLAEDSDTHTISPNVVVNPTGGKVCELGQSAELCANASEGTPPYTYAWLDPNDAPIGGPNDDCIMASKPGTYTVTVTDDNGCMVEGTAELEVLSPVLELKGEDKICEGGSSQFCVSVTGGSPPYSVQWLNGSGGSKGGCGGLPPGVQCCATVTEDETYQVIVMDANGCMVNDFRTLTVNEPPRLVPETEEICEGDDPVLLCANAKGGSPPYSYVWTDPNSVVLPDDADCILADKAGMYHVVVTDSAGCVSEGDAVLTVFSNPIAICKETFVCPSELGDVCVNVTGGTPTYLVELRNPLDILVGSCNVLVDGGQCCVTDLPAGTYTATVTDANGCTSMCTATLSEYPQFNVEALPSSTCAGQTGQLCVNVSGGDAPYTCEWFDESLNPIPSCTDTIPADGPCCCDGLPPGDYCVTVTDANGCVVGPICRITLSSEDPSINLPPNVNVCPGETIQVCADIFGGSPPYDVICVGPSGPVQVCADIQSGEQCCFEVSEPGEYCCTVFDSNDCEGTDCISVGSICEEPGWIYLDNGIMLTGNEPTYWSAFSGLPKGVSPFTALDPGTPPGRPDPDGSTDRVLRGYIIAFAVNNLAEEIRWNHLAGTASLVNYANAYAWQYNAYSFQTVDDNIAHGDETGTPGILNLDGVEYARPFSRLTFDFYAAGSPAFSGPQQVVTIGDLTLLPVDSDFRQDPTNGVATLPTTTKAKFDVWNMNEVKFSELRRCITCWDQTLMSRYSPPNHFLLQNLHTDKGSALVDGLYSHECNFDANPSDGALGNHPDDIVSRNTPLLGVIAQFLSFTGGPQFAAAGTNLKGIGTEPAIIKFDTLDEPQEAQGGGSGKKDGTAGTGGIAGAPPFGQDRVSMTDKGSLLIYPKVELRWNSNGALIQDTFISILNDHNDDVEIQMYFIHGDPPIVFTP